MSEAGAGGNGAGPAPLLQLEAVDTYYGPIHILQGVNLQVRQGELVCLLGGNASGKSTTLKTVLGIVRPRNGAVADRESDSGVHRKVRRPCSAPCL